MIIECIFLIFALNMLCWSSLERPFCRSKGCPQPMFLSQNKRSTVSPGKPHLVYHRLLQIIINQDLAQVHKSYGPSFSKIMKIPCFSKAICFKGYNSTLDDCNNMPQQKL